MLNNPVINLVLSSDSYKYSHWTQYPLGTERVSSYIEARGGEFERIVFLGIQAFIKKYLLKPITEADVNEAEAIILAHGEPFNKAGWLRIVNEHNGFIPVTIQALPEGTVARPGVPLVQVYNNDPKLPWITSFIETALLRSIWYPTTVASLSRAAKEVIYANLLETSDAPNAEIGFKLHDFGQRGASSQETAMLGGMAHLVNFMGSDTVEAIVAIKDFYGYDGMPSFSIPAAEHSTMTAWGRDQEAVAYSHMIDLYDGPGKLFSVVSDSWDIFNAVENIWGGVLKDKVENMKGTLVVRPDSGSPVETPIEVIKILMDKFGYKTNTKGYKVLPDYLRVIQGDGIDLDTIDEILSDMKELGLSGSNIAFGMGGGLLQSVNRDTCKFAMKANAACINGVWREVFKDPIGGGKTSKKGIQKVVKGENGVLIAKRANYFDDKDNLMKVVYRMEKTTPVVSLTTFDDVRKRASEGLTS